MIQLYKAFSNLEWPQLPLTWSVCHNFNTILTEIWFSIQGDRKDSLIKSAMFNYLKCNTSNIWFYDSCFFFGLEKSIENSENFKFESLKLESLHWSWKELIEVWKFSIHYSIIKYFKTLARTFQFHFSQFYFELSNLKVSNFSF